MMLRFCPGNEHHNNHSVSVFCAAAACALAVFSFSCTSRDIRLDEASLRYPASQPYENSGFADIDGIKIHFRSEMPEEGEKPLAHVAFFHGLAGSTFSWSRALETLGEAGYAAVAVDIPPFGFSDKGMDVPRDIESLSRIMWKTLDAVDADAEQWILVAHSMSGRIVTRMTALQSGRVKALSYYAGAVYESRMTDMGFFALPLVRQIVEGFVGGKMRDFASVKDLLKSAYGLDPSDDDVMGYIAPFLVDGAPEAFVDFALGQEESAGNFQEKLEKSLAAIQVPAFLVWGEEDSWVSIENGRRLTRDIEDSAMFIIPGGGHCVMETHHETSIAELLGFLLRVCGTVQ